jgi:subtilisin family serine protease
VRIAVVDSGVAAGHPHVGNVIGGVYLTPSEETTDFSDRLGHGTAVSAAIREKAAAAELLAVKVFDRALATNADVLGRAIRWAADNGARLINLSLGTPNEQHRPALAAALDYASERGALIVAAVEYEGRAMFPGSLPGAVAVRLDPDCPRDALIVGDDETFGASGYPRPIPGVPPDRNLYGVSFAVANTTGLLARLLQGGTQHLSAREIVQIVLQR